MRRGAERQRSRVLPRAAVAFRHTLTNAPRSCPHRVGSSTRESHVISDAACLVLEL